MIFNFLKYLRPTWYFNLRPKVDYAYFPTEEILRKSGHAIEIDTGYKSKEAFYGEDKVPQPASNYGVSKLAAEQLVLFHAREEKLKACSLRLYSVFGPRERPDKLYPKLIHAAYSGEAFTLFEGSEKHLRSFTFVDDIVDGIVSVIGKEVEVNTQVFNLGTEVESTTQQGIDCVERLTNKKINVVVVPKRAGDQLRTQAVITKAREVLNYNPRTTLEEGIRKHIEWYLNTK